jgi:hypothetical protein
MDISKYTDFFHDGSVIDIQHKGNGIQISMSSAEVDEEDLQDDIALSKYDRIQGKLHIEGVKNITINKNPFFGELKKIYDDGSILHFDLKCGYVELEVVWGVLPPDLEKRDFTAIGIEASKIWWEAIPDLEDPLF